MHRLLNLSLIEWKSFSNPCTLPHAMHFNLLIDPMLPNLLFRPRAIRARARNSLHVRHTHEQYLSHNEPPNHLFTIIIPETWMCRLIHFFLLPVVASSSERRPVAPVVEVPGDGAVVFQLGDEIENEAVAEGEQNGGLLGAGLAESIFWLDAAPVNRCFVRPVVAQSVGFAL
jgi:hypothetical protein